MKRISLLLKAGDCVSNTGAGIAAKRNLDMLNSYIASQKLILQLNCVRYSRTALT